MSWDRATEERWEAFCAATRLSGRGPPREVGRLCCQDRVGDLVRGEGEEEAVVLASSASAGATFSLEGPSEPVRLAIVSWLTVGESSLGALSRTREERGEGVSATDVDEDAGFWGEMDLARSTEMRSVGGRPTDKV